MQDARARPSKGFRPPFGLGRVTLERPKVTKSLFPRQTARFAGSLVSSNGSDGAPQTAHPCAGCGCAIIPDGAPDPLNSTRRFAGGPIPCLPMALSFWSTVYYAAGGEQCKGLAKYSLIGAKECFGNRNENRSSRLRF